MSALRRFFGFKGQGFAGLTGLAQRRSPQALVCSFAALLSACAVQQSEVKSRFEQAQKSNASAKDELQQRLAAQQGLLVMVNAPYLSNRSTKLGKEAQLPAAFRNSSSFERPRGIGAGFTISEVAGLITKRYGIRVRIRPDVFLPTSSLIPGGGTAGTSAPASASASTPAASTSAASMGSAALPPPLAGVAGRSSAGFANTALGTSATAGDYGSTVDFDFVGSLSDYLQRISAVMGINSEWDEGTQELLFYRLVTKTFTLDTTPSKMSAQSNVSKTSTGAGNTGASSGSASAQVSMDSDTWDAVEKALNTFKTRAGSVVVNKGTRTITVIDTKDVVEMADRFIAQQNDVISRQAMLSVRMMRVALQRNSAEGLDVNAAFKSFIDTANAAATTASWGASLGGGGSLVTGGGNLTYSVLRPNSSVNGSQVVAKFINEIGRVVDEYSQDIPVRNNRTVPVMDFGVFGYLSKTTGATSGLTGGTGTPGLETASVTSGTMLMLTPSIKNNESLVLSVGLDRSAEPTFDTISAGQGTTFQQVQLLRQRGIKIDTEIGMKNNETLILMGMAKDSITGNQQWGVTGASGRREGSQEVQFLLITPRIISGG